MEQPVKMFTLSTCSHCKAVKNLLNEGIAKGVYKVGDVMFDSVIYNTDLATKRSKIIKTLKPKL